MLGRMPLSEDLRRVADAAVRYADAGEDLTGIVPAEPSEGARVYLCAFAVAGGTTRWLAFDAALHPVESRAVLRDAISIAALCELAEEVAAGGDLDDLHARLVALRVTENPAGIDEAAEAVLALQQVVGRTPEVATPARLDEIGVATRRLEQALGESGMSPFAEGMKHAFSSVESLTRDVEANYKRGLS